MRVLPAVWTWGHWLNKRRAPSLVDMNRVLAALGLGYLEVALDIRERAAEVPPEKNYNPYFRYPVSDWKGVCEIREERLVNGEWSANAIA